MVPFARISDSGATPLKILDCSDSCATRARRGAGALVELLNQVGRSNQGSDLEHQWFGLPGGTPPIGVPWHPNEKRIALGDAGVPGGYL